MDFNKFPNILCTLETVRLWPLSYIYIYSN
uniref:Uncharacterized protein n=1 Tax=Anguilla anguilla TaxID=7936 RepID=A0A0E9TLK9_ANGAN